MVNATYGVTFSPETTSSQEIKSSQTFFWYQPTKSSTYGDTLLRRYYAGLKVKAWSIEPITEGGFGPAIVSSTGIVILDSAMHLAS
jgi:hypothetical protein